MSDIPLCPGCYAKPAAGPDEGYCRDCTLAAFDRAYAADRRANLAAEASRLAAGVRAERVFDDESFDAEASLAQLSKTLGFGMHEGGGTP